VITNVVNQYRKTTRGRKYKMRQIKVNKQKMCV